MATNEEDLQPDFPVSKQDFQEIAKEIGTEPGIGTRVYRDLSLRGWIYEAVVRKREGAVLTHEDNRRLEKYHSDYPEIYYFGDDAQDASDLSLNGLIKLYSNGAFDKILKTTDEKRYQTRKQILDEVIKQKTAERYQRNNAVE